MRIPERYYVEPIEEDVAEAMAVACHYAHREAPCSVAFGLFDSCDGPRFVGVITYGVGPSSTLRTGICGEDEADNVMELTRLWTEDGTPRNVESFFVTQSLKLLKRNKVTADIVVSFADPAFGHVGYVYQGSNWLYTGLGAPFEDPKHVDFPNQHHDSWAKRCADRSDEDFIFCQGCDSWFKKRPEKGERKFSLMQAVIEVYGWVCADDRYAKSCDHPMGNGCGGKVYLEERSRKHRYIFFNCSKRRRRRRKLMKKLRHPILPYPRAAVPSVP